MKKSLIFILSITFLVTSWSGFLKNSFAMEEEILKLRSKVVLSTSGETLSLEEQQALSSPAAKNSVAIEKVTQYFFGSSIPSKLTKIDNEDLWKEGFNVKFVAQGMYEGRPLIMLGDIKYSSKGGRPYYGNDFYTDAWLRRKWEAFSQNNKALCQTFESYPYGDILFRIASVYEPNGHIAVYLLDNTFERIVRNSQKLECFLSPPLPIEDKDTTASATEASLSELLQRLVEISKKNF